MQNAVNCMKDESQVVANQSAVCWGAIHFLLKLCRCSVHAWSTLYSVCVCIVCVCVCVCVDEYSKW